MQLYLSVFSIFAISYTNMGLILLWNYKNQTWVPDRFKIAWLLFLGEGDFRVHASVQLDASAGTIVEDYQSKRVLLLQTQGLQTEQKSESGIRDGTKICDGA